MMTGCRIEDLREMTRWKSLRFMNESRMKILLIYSSPSNTAIRWEMQVGARTDQSALTFLTAGCFSNRHPPEQYRGAIVL